MTTISRPQHVHQHSGPIHRGIDSGDLPDMPNEWVYEPISSPNSTTLPTRPIPPLPLSPMPTYPLFVALRIGCATRKPFTIRTTEHDAWLTYDPIAHWVTGSCVGCVDFWRVQARALNACAEGAQRRVIGAMLTYDPSLEFAQWAVTFP